MRKGYAVATLICILLTPIAAIVVARWVWIRNFNLPKDFITKQQLTEIDTLGPRLQDLGTRTKRGDLPTRYVDLATIGETDKESDLRAFRRFVELYEITFGKLPERASDLDRLTSIGALKSVVKLQMKSLASQCSIFTFGRDSYLLNCDGWQASGHDSPKRMVGNFDDTAEKFYASERHVFIYAPPSYNLKSASSR
jgi:hypothetical protein